MCPPRIRTIRYTNNPMFGYRGRNASARSNPIERALTESTRVAFVGYRWTVTRPYRRPFSVSTIR